MADPAVAFSGLSAILHLSSILVKLTKELRICAEAVHSTPKEIMIFIRETTNFTSLLNYFYDVARDATENVETGLRARRAKLVRRISQQCDYVSRGIEELVRRFAELSGGGSSSFQNLWARIMWLLRKPDVEGLRLSLHSAMAAVNLLTSFFMWEELRRKDGDGERAEMLREQIENGVPMARLARRALAEHQQKHGRVVQSVPYTSYDGMKEGTLDIEKIVVNTLRSYVRPEGHIESYPGRGRRLSRSQPEPTVVEPPMLPSRPSRAASAVEGRGQVNRHSILTSEGLPREARSMPPEHQNLYHHPISAPPPRRRRATRNLAETRSEGRRDSIPLFQKQHMRSDVSRFGDSNIMELEEEALSGRTETTTEQGSDLIGIAEAVRIKRVRTDTTVHELRREVVEIPRKRVAEGPERGRAGTWPQPRPKSMEHEGEGEDEPRGRSRWRKYEAPERDERGVEEGPGGEEVGVTERRAEKGAEGEAAREATSEVAKENVAVKSQEGDGEKEIAEEAVEVADELPREAEREVGREATEQRERKPTIIVKDGPERRNWLDILIKKDSGEAGPSRHPGWKPSTQIDDSGSSWTSYKGGSSKSIDSRESTRKSHESSRSGSVSPYKLKSSRGRRLQRRQLPSSV